jgi:dihydrofolate reductase
MRRVVVSEFVTLDGVMEDPGGSENTERGGWAFQFQRGPQGDKFKWDELMSAEALLLGRKTYEGFAAAWPGRDGEFADKMNGMQKYVVSRTLDHPAWNNTAVLRGNLSGEISMIKAMDGMDILVAGSAMLVHTLMEHDLVDEYRLMVYPIVLGKGKRLFINESKKTSMHLVDMNRVGDEGIFTLIFHPLKRIQG